MYLRLDDRDRTAQLGKGVAGFLGRSSDETVQDGDRCLAKKFFRLILVNLHAVSISRLKGDDATRRAMQNKGPDYQSIPKNGQGDAVSYENVLTNALPNWRLR